VVLQAAADRGRVDERLDAVLAQCSAGPTPESMSSCGLLTAPPDSTTSPRAWASCPAPSRT
jgi:hypothetical protein